MREFRRGDVFTADDANELRRRSEPIDVRASGGISVRSGRGAVNISGSQRLKFVGKAAANIAAATSTQWASGTVTRYQADASGNETSTGQTFNVLNPSSTTMTSGHGINSGQRCIVEEDSDGNLLVTPLECS